MEPVTIEAVLGTIFTVDCEESPATGFIWDCYGWNGRVTMIQDEFVSSDESVGGTGKHRFHFSANKIGVQNLVFTHHRPWETHYIEQQEVTVTVIAQADTEPTNQILEASNEQQ